MRGRRAHVARGQKANLVYGFVAGALFACFVVIGLLLTNAGIARFENIPDDAPNSARQTTPAPLVRDSYSAIEHKKISSDGKSSPLSTPKHHKKATTSPAGVTGATGTATGGTTKPSVPPASGTTPAPVPQPVKTKPPITIVIPPLLPGVKVTIPPLLPRL